jgi:hypothetical protein
MDFYIPTYHECIEIVETNPKGCFQEKSHLIDSYRISIFGYREAKFNNFILPLPERISINALELKGISYIFDDRGNIFNHHLMLHKFWEINQYPFCSYQKLKDKKIKDITTKEDGYMITYVKLPNKEIISQLKTGFDCDVNIAANKYLDQSNYLKFIEKCLKRKQQPIFEYISEKTKMTIDYKGKEELILIQLRDNTTGKYLNTNKITEVPVIKRENFKNINEILEESKTLTDKEGWVVRFTDDYFIKIKTRWYHTTKENKSGKKSLF